MSKISELSDGGALQSTDYLIAVRSGGNVKVQANGAASFTTLTASGDVNFDSGTFFVDASANAVGIGTSSPAAKLEASGNTGSGSDSEIVRITSTDSVSRVVLANSVGQGGIDTSGDNIRFTNTSSNTERMRIDSSGNVGYNGKLFSSNDLTTLGGLQLYRDHATGSCYLFDTTAAPFSGPLIFGTNNAEAMRIDASGNVGIGTNGDNPTALFEVEAASNPEISIASSGGATSNFLNFKAISHTQQIQTQLKTVDNGDFTSDLAFLFKATGTGGALSEKARLTASGNLLVGTATDGVFNGRMRVDGSQGAAFVCTGGAGNSATFLWNNAASGDNNFTVFYTETSATARGSITYNRAGGLVAYNTTSDYRAKDVTGPAANTGETIDALKVYTGKMKGASVERPMLIAHEAQEVTPYAVTGEKDAVNEDGTPNYQQMDHSSLVPLLIAEIQSLRARVAQLEQA